MKKLITYINLFIKTISKTKIQNIKKNYKNKKIKIIFISNKIWI